jgi:hypothetical protein
MLPRRADMTKFIQICASDDDLFALSEDGGVYQYNFSTETWFKLETGVSREVTA